MTLDEWSDDEIESMVEVGGNSSANAIYEAFVPGGYEKPGPDASHELRAKFIRLDMIYNFLSIHLCDTFLRHLCVWLPCTRWARHLDGFTITILLVLPLYCLVLFILFFYFFFIFLFYYC